jgi:phosphoribosylformimino-5-aminoimidazole carboxamide ribonucleotide (ProFAR) isomerase
MIIIISSPVSVQQEHIIVNQLFDEGLDFFQLYKPFLSKEETESFRQQISPKYRNRVVLHSDYPKFHTLNELEKYQEKYDYAFLSPVFDSISKAGYQSKFNLSFLKEALKNRSEKIIALGGIDEDKLDTVKELGFAGIAMLGAIWQSENPVEKFKQIRERWLK